jgi:hypothetical protein
VKNELMAKTGPGLILIKTCKVEYGPITPIELDVSYLEKDVWKSGNQVGK